MQKCANDPNTSSTVKTYVQWDKRETSQNINNIFGKQLWVAFLILFSIFQFLFNKYILPKPFLFLHRLI